MVDQGLPPAKSYIDELLSYASNEYAIDYNAPLFFTLAFQK
jgi:endoglucanase